MSPSTVALALEPETDVSSAVCPIPPSVPLRFLPTELLSGILEGENQRRP
jgi:hypothetical protein